MKLIVMFGLYEEIELKKEHNKNYKATHVNLICYHQDEFYFTGGTNTTVNTISNRSAVNGCQVKVLTILKSHK